MSPRHNTFVQAMLRAPFHVIATMRAKTHYEPTTENGKLVPKKTGLAPIQRPGTEYEFDMLCRMADAVLHVEKTRCDRIDPGASVDRPGEPFASLLADWIEDSDPPKSREEDMRLAVAAETERRIGEVRGGAQRQSARDLLVAYLRDHRIPRDPFGAEALARFDAELPVAA
jgi:hypothetical protein